MAKKSEFVHLHLHTEYSLLDGLSKIKPLFAHVQGLGMDSLAITDHGAMYGAIEFYKAAQDYGVKPIIGMEGYITKKRTSRGEGGKKPRNYHILLLAKNQTGYKNLMKLTSIGHLEGYYYRPRIDHEVLKKYSEGIICTSACAASELSAALVEDDYKKAKEVAQWHLDVFGEDYYLEVQRHQYEKHLAKATIAEIRDDLTKQAENEKKINEGVVSLSRELGIPIIATNDAHYIEEKDAAAQDALVCVYQGKDVSEINRLRFIDAPAFYVSSEEEMKALFPDIPEAITNTRKVADKCDLEITLGQYFFPEIELEDGKSAEEQLREKAYEGLQEKFGEVTEELKERLEYEIGVIVQKEYPAYFLIYKDMADWARSQKIPINTRGSAAGSLASYCLGITSVDPMHYQLPFERFLNPFRPSAPDIDLDIADDKREEMIAHLVQTYGSEKVAQICTFGRMLAKGSVRDIARVLGYPYEVGDKIAKVIPDGAQGFPMTIKRALEESSEFKALYDSDSDARKIVDLAKQVEGNARHTSMHAAGVVVSPTELTDFTPLQHDEPNGKKLVTQYEMHAVEDVGLVKLDILGIRNLSILRGAIERVERVRGISIDLLKIPVDDKKTFEMLARGETMGTFQLSGSGMTRYLIDLKPERIEDIMIMIALYRPGPMMNIDEYIARKHGKKKVTYYHPKMEKFLDKSLGVLVYQDDLLYTALELAGYDWEEVDKFRKAVGKKIPEEMAKQHIKFVDGCVKHTGMSKKEAEGLWELFEPFQGYGFNKAHAASYGLVAYQTAYMKANYPVEYMAALLTAESNDTEKISQAVSECRRMGIEVLPPDINESEIGFTIVDHPQEDGKAIRFGLSAIKNVGNAAIDSILGARENGKFVSLLDFCSRVDGRKVNKKVIESLVKVGALSAFGNRAAVLQSLDEVRNKTKTVSAAEGQQGLFFEEEKKELETQAMTYQVVSDIDEFTEEELENLERELLGFSLSAKPIEETIAELVYYRTHKTDELTREFTRNREEVKICGVVSEVRVVTTKRTNAQMAFAKLDDEHGSADLVIFPKIFAETKDLWVEGMALLVTGKFDEREDGNSILVDSIDTPESMKDRDGKLVITIPKGVKNDSLVELRDVLRQHEGTQKVALIFEGNGSDEVLVPFGVSWTHELSREISQVLAVS